MYACLHVYTLSTMHTVDAMHIMYLVNGAGMKNELQFRFLIFLLYCSSS
jgi:hypothetical protein